MSELIALAGDREIGRVRMERGQLSFRYADAWLAESSWHFPSAEEPQSSFVMIEDSEKIIDAFAGRSS